MPKWSENGVEVLQNDIAGHLHIFKHTYTVIQSLILSISVNSILANKWRPW